MSVEVFAPEAAARRKVLEEAAADREIDLGSVYLGYWIGCQAFLECGGDIDADVTATIDYALSLTHPDDCSVRYGRIQSPASLDPIAKYAYVGVVESWWQDRGEIVGEQDSRWLRRNAALGSLATAMRELEQQRRER